eukprot:4608179-Amphidinium_carterae.1
MLLPATSLDLSTHCCPGCPACPDSVKQGCWRSGLSWLTPEMCMTRPMRLGAPISSLAAWLMKDGPLQGELKFLGEDAIASHRMLMRWRWDLFRRGTWRCQQGGREGIGRNAWETNRSGDHWAGAHALERVTQGDGQADGSCLKADFLGRTEEWQIRVIE